MDEKMLSNQKCEANAAKLVRLKGKELNEFLKLVKGWRAVEEKHLVREFKFQNYSQGLGFVNKAAQLAEKEQHHPLLCLDYGKVTVTLHTHSIGGISKNDLIMAVKIDGIKIARVNG